MKQADVLGTVSIPIRVDRQPASVILDLVEDGVRSCIEAAGMLVEDINSLCLGVPGIVERASGICRYSPIFSERDLRLGLDLQERLNVPTSVDSDVNLITLAEQWFGHGRDLSDFLVVSIEHTIGLGIVHAGELFRGAKGLSPDLGDLIMSPNGSIGNGSRPGRLSGIASTNGILSAAADVPRDPPGEAASRDARHGACRVARPGRRRADLEDFRRGRARPGNCHRKPDHAVRATKGHSRRVGTPGRGSPPQALARCGRGRNARDDRRCRRDRGP